MTGLGRTSILSALFTASGVFGFCLAIAVGSGGCSASPCTAAPGRKPSSAVECPAGTVCYQGACIRACSAGAEGVEKCTADEACTDPARPTCIKGFCSGCEAGEQCLPELDVCGPIEELNLDGGTRDAGHVSASKPLDGGAIDGSIFSRDTGTGEVVEIAPSYVGSVDISEVVTLPGDVTTSTIVVTVLDVRGTGRVESSTVVDPIAIDGGRCELLTHVSYPTRPAALANLGDINVDPTTSAGIDRPYKATFTPDGYVVAPSAGMELLVFSTLGKPTGVFVYGPGLSGVTAGAWPAEPRPSLHVPLEVIMAAETRALLSDVVEADAPPGGALTLRWQRENPRSFPGSQVSVRIDGPTWDLVCTADEDPGFIRVPQVLLTRFSTQPNLAEGTTLPLYFERVFSRQLDVAPAVQGERILFTVSIRHRYAGRIRF